MCAVASAAESVIVMMKLVVAKPEQREDEELSLPARKQILEHRDRAVAVRTFRGDAPVHRKRAKES